MKYHFEVKMKPYFETGLGKLYHGDCLEIISQLEIKTDLILTDPPYNETAHFKNIDLSNLGIIIESIMKDDSFLITDFYRRSLPRYLDIYKPLIYYDMMTAFVINSMASCSLGVDRFTPSLIFKKGIPKVKAKWSNVIQVTRKGKRDREYTGHPAQKYLDYYIKIIRMFSNINDLILDPFMGSGTTGMACEIYNRRWIGIEISKEYCDIAVDRIKKETDQLKLELL